MRFKGKRKLPQVVNSCALPTPLQRWAGLQPTSHPAVLREGKGRVMHSMYLNLSVLPGKTSSCAGFLAATEAVAEQRASTGITCNQATMRTEQRGQNWIPL